jgi:hypothetical protein
MSPPDAIDAYLETLSADRQQWVTQLVTQIRESLPPGFEEVIQYDMPSWVVPRSLYPQGYHANPDLPLPFLSVGSRKSHVAMYHMGLYADEDLLTWFNTEYPKHSKTKLNMGKSCVRFKKVTAVPLDLIGTLCTKMTPAQWIAVYEDKVKPG